MLHYLHVHIYKTKWGTKAKGLMIMSRGRRRHSCRLPSDGGGTVQPREGVDLLQEQLPQVRHSLGQLGRQHALVLVERRQRLVALLDGGGDELVEMLELLVHPLQLAGGALSLLLVAGDAEDLRQLVLPLVHSREPVHLLVGLHQEVQESGDDFRRVRR